VSVYSTQFFCGPLPAAGSNLVYTVPGAQTVVIRDIETYISVANESFNVQVSVAGASGVVWATPTTVAVGWYQWQGRVVVPPAGEIFIYGSYATTQCIISGYLLSP
jgi:hypothetical protein